MVFQPVAAIADTPALNFLPETTPAPMRVNTPPTHDSTLGTVQDDPLDSIIVPRRAVVVSAFQTTGGPQFIQLYNTNSESTAPIDMSNWHITVQYSDMSSCDISIDQAIFAHSYVLLAQSGGGLAADANAEVYNCPAAADAVAAQLRVYDGDTLVERLTPNPQSMVQQWQRKGTTAKYLSGVVENDFKPVDPPAAQFESDPWYVAPPRPSLKLTELLVNPRDCLPGDIDKSCYDYVKLKNTGISDIDLSSYRLRTGYKNTDARSTNTIYLYGSLPAGMTVRIDHNADGSPVSITANDGTAWLEDSYGIAPYDLQVAPYIGSASTTHQGQSWAYDESDASWKWGVPAPMSVRNNFTLPVSPVASTSATPQYAPCAPGQYRSTDTHRCRSTTAAASTLQPCGPNQTRNPVTNRCRGVLGASTTLKPCAAGQERNPDTNRCRKVQTKLASADFAVEPVKQGTKAFAGWWALGGIAVLAAGYATWEWRDEIRRTITRFNIFGK